MVIYHSPHFDNLNLTYDFVNTKAQYEIDLPTNYYPSPTNSMNCHGVDMNGALNGTLNGALNGSGSTGSGNGNNVHISTISGSGSGTNISTSTTTTTTATTSTTTPSNPSKKIKSIYYNNVANIVCLLWFNDINLLIKTLNQAQSINSYSNCKSPQFSRHSIPTNSFKQFIANVITRTQLPPTAVSLALLYILRLKKLAPLSIVGSANSEYRVFSVALILTNKYLDDNTYTNKTWSDITRLPLKELSAMEIEFLGNMRYSLHVEQAEWKQWQRQLKVWLNIHYWVCDNFNTTANSINTSPVISTCSSTNTSPTSTTINTVPKSNLSYLSLVSPPLRGVNNTSNIPPLAINQYAPPHPQPQPQPPINYPAIHQVQQPPPPLSLPTPPINPNQHNNYTPNEIITPPSSRKRVYVEDNSPTIDYLPPNKRQTINPYNHPPALRTLINSNMPQLPPQSLPQHLQQAPLPAPIYYIVSQRKTFSPHYGYPQSTYLLPQQYQFELQHYIPTHPTPSTLPNSSHLRPVQFLSPTTSNNNVYCKTPTYSSRYYTNSAQHFSSPPSHY